jgi:hypothetical protein
MRTLKLEVALVLYESRIMQTLAFFFTLPHFTASLIHYTMIQHLHTVILGIFYLHISLSKWCKNRKWVTLSPIYTVKWNINVEGAKRVCICTHMHRFRPHRLKIPYHTENL